MSRRGLQHSFVDGPTSMGKKAVRAVTVPSHLIRAGQRYDDAHPIDLPDPGFKSPGRKGGSVAKLPCSRCGEPRRSDALKDGQCRSTRACNEFMNGRWS